MSNIKKIEFLEDLDKIAERDGVYPNMGPIMFKKIQELIEVVNILALNDGKSERTRVFQNIYDSPSPGIGNMIFNTLKSAKEYGRKRTEGGFPPYLYTISFWVDKHE